MPAALLAVMLLGLWVNQGALRELLLGDAPPLSPLPSASNRLALGEVTAVKGALTLPIAALAEFDGLSREQILALRREAVARQPKLLQGEYVPTPSVFGHIEGGRPWWGLAGRFYFGPGGESIAGLSTQSQHVLNPYLLVGADFWCDCRIGGESDPVPGWL